MESNPIGINIQSSRDEHLSRNRMLLEKFKSGELNENQYLGILATISTFLEFKAKKDKLTSAYNRTSYDEVVDRLITNPESLFSLLIIDIDHFKKFNDTYGHKAGDEVLKKVSDKIQSAIRQGDFMARYGGEEFVILLPIDTEEELSLVAEKIRSEVEKMSEINFGGKLLDKVTISVGAGIYDHSKPYEDFFNDIDNKALYDAKAAGRNCVRVFKSS